MIQQTQSIEQKSKLEHEETRKQLKASRWDLMGSRFCWAEIEKYARPLLQGEVAKATYLQHQ